MKECNKYYILDDDEANIIGTVCNALSQDSRQKICIIYIEDSPVHRDPSRTQEAHQHLNAKEKGYNRGIRFPHIDDSPDKCS